MPLPSETRWLRWPGRAASRRMAYGADYNPEQWPRPVWDEDVRLMRVAGVNIVSLAIFSWAKIQPAPGEWDFAWLDDAMDLLHAHEIAVDLATATASPPPWLSAEHPEVLPVTRSGQTVWPGARQHWRPTSPVFRAHALVLVRALAERYAEHPALTAWHVSNELGCHNAYDYSDDAAAAFRVWLRARYGTLDGLNHAWGTAFWAQRYGEWGQVLPPRLVAAPSNPTQQLDFKRFSSDALKEHLRAERAVLRELTPDVPVTTNFMLMGETNALDYADWAGEVDFVANDHYVRPSPQASDELSFSANHTSGIAGGAPWFLMETSTSAVNWQSVNVAKREGELVRDALTHVAHGADAVCFFQWRASSAGAERYHSAMVPHAGEDSAVFRTVTQLGELLDRLAEVQGSRRRSARAAVLFDWDSWWASELEANPTDRLHYRAEALDWYSAFLGLGVPADVVPAGTPLTDYAFVVAPVLHVVPQRLADQLSAYVHAGGHLVTTFFSGIVDENAHVLLGGYPGALRELLGVRVEEFGPLLDGEQVELSNGAVGTVWTDRLAVVDDDVVTLAAYTSGEQSGRPALTRRVVGAGSAAYLSTRLGPQGLQPVLAGLLAAAGVASELPSSARGRVELTVRTDGRSDFVFLVNRTDEQVDVDTPGELLLGSRSDGQAAPVRLGPREVAVLRRTAP